MNRIPAIVAAAAGAILIGVLTATPPMSAQSQQTSCDVNHPDHVARRRGGITFTRHVNTQQSRAFSAAKRYLPIGNLTLTESVPEGYELTLSADEQGYSFSVIDRKGPCRFAFFSNQNGVIYTGQPLQ
jgi:hypothetical protein